MTNGEKAAVAGAILLTAILAGRFGAGGGPGAGGGGRSGTGRGRGRGDGVGDGATKTPTRMPAAAPNRLPAWLAPIDPSLPHPAAIDSHGPVLLRLDHAGASVDGVPVSESLAVRLCVAMGSARVVATGDATEGLIRRVVGPALAAGVRVDAPASVLDSARAAVSA